MSDIISALINLALISFGGGSVGGIIIVILQWYLYKFPEIETNLKIDRFFYDMFLELDLKVKNVGDATASGIICNFAPNWTRSRTINVPDLDPKGEYTCSIKPALHKVDLDLSIVIKTRYIRKLWKIKMRKVITTVKKVKFSADHQKKDISISRE